MGFFEWWTDLQYSMRTDPHKAFKVGCIMGVLMGFFIFGLLALTAEGFTTIERIGIFVGGMAGLSLLSGGILALKARFFSARVSTYQRKAGLSEQEALQQSLADSRQAETIEMIAATR